jgi:hypothetical protein
MRDLRNGRSTRMPRRLVLALLLMGCGVGIETTRSSRGGGTAHRMAGGGASGGGESGGGSATGGSSAVGGGPAVGGGSAAGGGSATAGGAATGGFATGGGSTGGGASGGGASGGAATGGGAAGGGAPGGGTPFLPGTFIAIKEPDDLQNVSGLFTTGGQYVDPGNGVLQDSWSMLVRWQGDTLVDAPVSYDLGAFTGFTTPLPGTSWQRGFQPEDSSGTPGVQLSGMRAGILINTWAIPHRFIEGGGYNDMYGYAFGPGHRPLAFVADDGMPAQLVLQSLMAVPEFGAWQFDGTSWQQAPYGDRLTGDGQLDLFAYLEDQTHPALHPIALVVVAFGNRMGPCAPDGSPGSVSADYPGGVWFGASGICTTDITTRVYSTPTQTQLFSDERFFRIHITPANWQTLIARINAAGAACSPGTCPASGYSTDPSQYRLQYAGVIQEIALLENGAPNNASAIRQVSMGSHVNGVGIYRYR